MDLSLNKSRIAFVIVVAVLFGVVICSRKDPFQEHGFSKDHPMHATNRSRLLVADGDYIHTGGECSTDNIYISQGQMPPLTNGIPTYLVEVQNVCVPGTRGGSCIFYNIHLSCGWFSSAQLINPNLFKRIAYNDCLVNNGDLVQPGQTIAFEYAETYPYPLSVASMSCY